MSQTVQPVLLYGVLYVLESAESVAGLNKENSDCYATVDLHTARVGRTRVVHSTVHPIWNESFRLLCAHECSHVMVNVKDDDDVGAKELGQVAVPVTQLLSGEPVQGWFDLVDKKGNRIKHGPSVSFRLQFIEASKDPAYNAGIGDGSRFPGLVNTYYPLRTGCSVRLFQDAHVKDGAMPPIYLAGGKPYEPKRCWEEIYEALSAAQHFIYISGWSVYGKIELVRDPARMIPGSQGVTFGELLKRKADEGVRVLLLVWDDKTSQNSPFLQKGIMKTYDQDTLAYFKSSKVECVLCPRIPDKSLSFFQGLQIGTLFTHHQKMAVMDAPFLDDPHSGTRRLVGFVGGIDLCHGRYDNQDHSVFRTLNTVHSQDFHQGCFDGASHRKGGPREPWHDIHSRVEGPIAWDVLNNFEQRWLKQAGAKNDHLLVQLTQIPAIQPPAPVNHEADPETWGVQLLRSIDGGSVVGLPEVPEEISAAGLVSGKGNVVERSIQDGMIQAIRRAQRFLYIENQYFLGSCHMWEKDQAVGCFNLIPVEIALKIVRKIEAGERFTAYIVIPLYPDGVPEAGSTQAILDWQRKTMQMMYSLIAKALRANGRYNEHPRDYLTFFCLGNREAERPDDFRPTERPDPESDYFLSQIHRRFMVYVHSKLLIVDDEFVIVGSANINQRSQDGSRDTELAIGAFQPHHTMGTSADGLPLGEIHGFRMSLWAEHTGIIESTFLQPWSVECMRRMNEIAQHNWNTFADINISDMAGHLMRYPIEVAIDGSVTSIEGQEFIPDTKALVAGKKSGTLPEILTT
eukprot:jgi/Mesen1/8695/ME000052S08121